MISQNSSRSKERIFAPKLFSLLKEYTLFNFFKDLQAGIIVGIVALPLAIAFGIASGVTPEKGLITAVVAGFFVSLFGGSRVQVGGPTGAFVVIVYHIVEVYGVQGLIGATLIAGLMLIFMGVCRLGTIIKFVPYPVTVGFTSGIAVVIFSSQVRDLLGLTTGALPGDFIAKWNVYFHTIGTLNPVTVAVSLGSLILLGFWPRISSKIPASIVVILVMTAIVQFFHLPVETIGSRFGSIPTGLPLPSLPTFNLSILQKLISPAFTIAILGAIESLLSATVADGMIEGRHRSNTELIAQGIANIASSLFGGIPATGAIARTATNVKNGGRTPVAGLIHAFTLFIIMLLFGKWAALIPMSLLAAILLIVSYHMSEWRTFLALLKAPKMDIAVLLITFFLTVLIDLTVAVEIGLLLSLVMFMKRMTDVTQLREITREMQDRTTEQELRSQKDSITSRKIPEGVSVFEAEGAFFFGVAEILKDILNMGSKVLILRMRHVLVLDATGLRALHDLHHGCKKKGVSLILSGASGQPLTALKKSEFWKEITGADVVGSIDDALARARALLS